MAIHPYYRSLSYLIILLLAASMTHARERSPRDLVLSIPAETVQATIQSILPLTIPAHHELLRGEIILESLDQLSIDNNIITVSGMLSGRNLVAVTNIAGQDILLRLGQARLPVTCDLITRFDSERRELYVTPRFRNPGQNNNQESSLAPLLGALAGREFHVDLDALRLIGITIGDRLIPLALDPVNIVSEHNSLIVFLQPKVHASN
ncbi:hypothetical protein [Desulfobulbus alkaliphilus]|uniref:hypothetical protein n=1 Tax=Desulfobulbus alkaliphilus TaxID=869814 RepID=UPI001966AD6B|nr:hypothetical protein [Desulfobulbus alkaliphilus]MBM9536898.1 hypothetical protein [Desulfobulbus alkaliphilus]